MNIVFMGTPDFAVPCLARLIADGHNILGVFSQPDKPQGRHMTLTAPPVKALALSHKLPVYQPRGFRNGKAAEILRKLSPDLIVVVAYGKILPKAVLDIPRLGCVNIHGSLLPKLRGAAPIQWAVLNGDAVTGVSAMLLDEGMDTGDVLLMRETPIGANETAGELFDRLSALGAALLGDTVPALAAGTLNRVKQDNSAATHAPMLNKSICSIPWQKSAPEVHNHIRGLNPWPIALTTLAGKTVKVYESALAGATDAPAGTVIDSAGRLVIACGNGSAVELRTLQPQGKKQMTAAQFLAGNPVEAGSRLI